MTLREPLMVISICIRGIEKGNLWVKAIKRMWKGVDKIPLPLFFLTENISQLNQTWQHNKQQWQCNNEPRNNGNC